MRPPTGFSAALISLLLFGCGEPTAKPSATANQAKKMVVTNSSVGAATNGEIARQGTPSEFQSIVPPPPAGAVAPKAANTATTLTDINLAGWTKKISELAGKIVVVDAWATWCIPCRAKFPKYLELAQKFDTTRFAFLTLAVDETNAEKATEFLTGQKSGNQNFRLVDTLTAEWQKQLGFREVPHYFVYDNAGKVIFHTDKVEDLEAKLSTFQNRRTQ